MDGWRRAMKRFFRASVKNAMREPLIMNAKKMAKRLSEKKVVRKLNEKSAT